MTKSRRRAGWLVVGLVGMSLMTAARGAEAYGPFRWPEPPLQIGDPDTPPSLRKPPLVPDVFRFIVVPQARLAIVIPKFLMVPRVSRLDRSIVSGSNRR